MEIYKCLSSIYGALSIISEYEQPMGSPWATNQSFANIQSDQATDNNRVDVQ